MAEQWARIMTFRIGIDDAVRLNNLVTGDDMSANEVFRRALRGHYAARREDPAFVNRLREVLDRQSALLRDVHDE